MTPLHRTERQHMNPQISRLFRNIFVVVATAKYIQVISNKLSRVSIARPRLNSRTYKDAPFHVDKIEAPQVIQRAICPSAKYCHLVRRYLTARMLSSSSWLALLVSCDDRFARLRPTVMFQLKYLQVLFYLQIQF